MKKYILAYWAFAKEFPLLATLLTTVIFLIIISLVALPVALTGFGKLMLALCLGSVVSAWQILKFFGSRAQLSTNQSTA